MFGQLKFLSAVALPVQNVGQFLYDVQRNLPNGVLFFAGGSLTQPKTDTSPLMQLVGANHITMGVATGDGAAMKAAVDSGDIHQMLVEKLEANRYETKTADGENVGPLIKDANTKTLKHGIELLVGAVEGKVPKVNDAWMMVIDQTVQDSSGLYFLNTASAVADFFAVAGEVIPTTIAGVTVSPKKGFME